ncbi:MAG: anti-sigma factor [Acidobacteria bacterium]|nr:anti-sigma factor [Acidobacteriota bacterium]
MERHDDIREQLTDYALGELSVSAREQVRAHLAGCPECAADARELSVAFHGIGLAGDPMAPPAHLKARVLAQLEHEPRSNSRSNILPLRESPRARRPHPAWLALAATTVLVVGGMLALSQQRAARLADELLRAHGETARLTTDAATVAGQADLAVAILTATDMRRIDLEGFDVSRNATARAYWSGTKGLLIVADRLPTPPPGRTYQVWLIGGDSSSPVSAGLIDGRRAGRGMLIVPPPGGVTGRTVTVAVTDEPEGGLPAPTGSKHLVGSL